MVAASGALAAGDKSVIDELLDEFFNLEAEATPGLTAACNSTDFSSVPGADSCSDFLSDGVGKFLTDDYTLSTRSLLENPMNYSSMVAAECRAALLNASFSGDPVCLDGDGGGLDVPNDQLQRVTSIVDEASFAGENIQKTPAVSGVDETSDPTSQAARLELDSSGSSKPGSKRLHDDSPTSTLDSELDGPSGAATVGVRSEKSKAAKTTTMATLKKRKAARAASDRRRCVHCQTDKTPQWRTGPEGPKTLCNACGMRFKSGRLVPEYRPASSPSFVGSHHSNSHRKVLELRRQKSILEQEQEQRRQLFGTSCRHDIVFGLPPAMPPPDALFHASGSRRQFQSLED